MSLMKVVVGRKASKPQASFYLSSYSKPRSRRVQFASCAALSLATTGTVVLSCSSLHTVLCRVEQREVADIRAICVTMVVLGSVPHHRTTFLLSYKQ